MKQFYFLLLFSIPVFGQPSVKGNIVLDGAAHSRDFIVRHTKVVLLTKTSCDTVMVNDKLEFEFRSASKGTALLYLYSPVLPHRTEYKFRINKRRPTHVSLRYEKFQTEPERRIKTPEEREEDLEKGVFFLRLAAEFALLIQAVTR